MGMHPKYSVRFGLGKAQRLPSEGTEPFKVHEGERLAGGVGGENLALISSDIRYLIVSLILR